MLNVKRVSREVSNNDSLPFGGSKMHTKQNRNESGLKNGKKQMFDWKCWATGENENTKRASGEKLYLFGDLECVEVRH